MFSWADEFAYKFVTDEQHKKSFMTIFGLIAFVLVDTANEMVLVSDRKGISNQWYGF